jgi:hypothetical protein
MPQDLMIVPSYPFRPGGEPTHVEYEATPPDGQSESVLAALRESARIEVDPPFRIRYRFVWNGRPGAWNDEGVTWDRPPP